MTENDRDMVIKRYDELVEKLVGAEKVIKALNDLAESGALDTIVELMNMVHLSKDIISDEMISGSASLASTLLNMGSKLNMPTISKIIDALLNHQIELEEEIKRTRVTGIWSLVKILRDKEIQRGLSIIFAFLKILGRHGSGEINK